MLKTQNKRHSADPIKKIKNLLKNSNKNKIIESHLKL
jgi:hypothetical protein